MGGGMSEQAVVAAVIVYIVCGMLVGLLTLVLDRNSPVGLGGVMAWLAGNIFAWPIFWLCRAAYNKGRFGP